MTAPQKPLIERVAEAVQKVPLSISSTRRSGQNGLRNAEEVARAALAACELEEVVTTLRQIRREYGANMTVSGQTLVTVDKLLARLDGKAGAL